MDEATRKRLEYLTTKFGVDKANDTLLRELSIEHGVADAAKLIGKRYATVRNRAVVLGIPIIRGRKRSDQIQKRNEKIRKLRTKKMYLRDIGKAHGIGRERVRQILLETGGDPFPSTKT